MPTLHFLEAANKRPLVKTYTDNDTISYPLIKKFNSYAGHCADITDMYNTITDASNKGWCLLKGQLETPLKEESRKGKVNRDTKTDWLAIDIDGLEWPTKNGVSKSLKEVDNYCISLLPEAFADVSHVFQASASFGLKGNKLSAHMFFHLEEEVRPNALKNYLIYQNFEDEILKEQIKLSVNGAALSYVIDPSITDNSRLIYIAKPLFTGNRQDPIASDRILLIDKEKKKLLIDTSISLALVKSTVDELIKTKRTDIGLKSKTLKTKLMADSNGDKVTVITNPDPMDMQFASEESRYIRYNIGDGDSNAYWVHKFNPQIVHNFKGEDPFLFEVADPGAYKAHCEKYDLNYSINSLIQKEVEDDAIFNPSKHKKNNDEVEPPEPEKQIPIGFQDRSTSKYYYGTINSRTKRTEIFTARNERNIANFLAGEGISMPDNTDVWTYEFQPHNKEILNTKKKFINKYQIPEHLETPVPIDIEMHGATLETGLKRLRKLCPYTARLLLSICGDGETEARHFINWLANIVQNKGKARTAWVFHGVPGTGKGMFYHSVLSPLIGQKYCNMKTLPDLEEKFNAWIAETLLFVVDEVKINSRNTTIINKLKNIITEPRGTIRGMQTEQIERDLYANLIFFSNDRDAIKLQDGDRRYNIAPRQETPLIKSNPDLMDPEVQNNIFPAEVKRLASLLLHFNVDTAALSIPLANFAKDQMRYASEDSIDSFARALLEGDFNYFVPIFEERLKVVGEDYVTPAKMFMKTMLRNMKPGEKFLINISELIPLYSVLCGKVDTQIKFTKMMGHHGIIFTRKRRNGEPARQCYEMSWQLDDIELQTLRKHYLADEYAQFTPANEETKEIPSD